MTRRPALLRYGAPWGLVLLFLLPAMAQESLHDTVRKEMGDQNYVLVADRSGARLFVFSDEAHTTGAVLGVAPPPPGSIESALTLTQNESPRVRVRGLVELSGVESPEALDAALVLLSDPVASVREEAVQLILEHPDADTDAIVAVASEDPSPRVREAVDDLISERSGD